MTGFAAVAAELPGVSLAVELRSVNHRYLDLQLRLPDELRALETALRERSPPSSKRGKVECRVSLGRAAAGRRRPRGRPAAGRAARRAAAATCARLTPGAAPLSVAEILRWPGVLAEPSVAARGTRRRARRTLVGAGAGRSRCVARARGREARRDARRALRRHRDAGRPGRAADPGDPRRLRRQARRAPARGRRRSRRGPAEAGAGAVRHQGRRRRGSSRGSAPTSPRCAACSPRAAARASASTS